MFDRFRKKTFVRMLEINSQTIHVEPKFIAVSLPNGKLLLLFGNFQSYSDQQIAETVQPHLNRVAA